uniref:EF-hand domain-containing protein n=1 Tax=Zonotrichia albicollis TaxID=44394 RepID=A0A8D2M7G4_ZONAL
TFLKNRRKQFYNCLNSTAEHRMVFEVCNEDRKGYLSREDSTLGLVMFYLLETLKVVLKNTLIYVIFLLPILNLKDRGFLPFEDFKRAFNSVSSKLSEKILFEATREVDRDSDGCISFKEFDSAMKYGQDEVSPVYFA